MSKMEIGLYLLTKCKKDNILKKQQILYYTSANAKRNLFCGVRNASIANIKIIVKLLRKKGNGLCILNTKLRKNQITPIKSIY